MNFNEHEKEYIMELHLHTNHTHNVIHLCNTKGVYTKGVYKPKIQRVKNKISKY